MAELPSLAPQGGGVTSTASAPAAPFTEAQVDEYREQDRWLPVSLEIWFEATERGWECMTVMEGCPEMIGWMSHACAESLADVRSQMCRGS